MASAPQPLLRLAAHVEQQLPVLLLFALARWVGAGLARPLLRPLLRRLLAPLRPQIERLPAKGAELRLPGAVAVLVAAAYSAMVWRDFNDGDLARMSSRPDCRPLDVPRPAGIAAGVGLGCFALTTRLSVSVHALVVLLCAKDANPFVLFASVLTMVDWVQPPPDSRAWLFALITGAMAASHATACTSSSSAALAVAAWAWVPRALARAAWRVLRSAGAAWVWAWRVSIGER